MGVVCLGELQELEGKDRKGHQGCSSILQFPQSTRYPWQLGPQQLKPLATRVPGNQG